MDTIIYLYRWKRPNIAEQQNNQKQQNDLKRQDRGKGLAVSDMQEFYCREDFAMLDYQLIKVGMSERLLLICQNNCEMESGRRTLESGGLLAKHRRKKQLQQERLLLSEFLRDTGAEQNAACFVCEESVPYFADRYFNSYFEADWVRHMLRYGGYPSTFLHGANSVDVSLPIAHFVLLGQTACVAEIVFDLVRSMKSLKWILPERQFGEEQQELVDILYEEYGLAVEVRLFSEEESYKQVYPVCRMPSLILDFSEADKIPTMDVARGSIWLDMASSEEKRRRIEGRDTGIAYFSLKKEWKHPQKALNHLDTIGKNGYNT